MHIYLTQLQSYNAMYKLLEHYYKQTNFDGIGSLLGDMLFLADGDTADSAIWEDWEEAINNKRELTKPEAFEGMIKFLEIYYGLTSSADAKLLIDKMRSAKDCNDMQVALVNQWNSCVKEALNEPKNTRQYLKLTKK